MKKLITGLALFMTIAFGRSAVAGTILSEDFSGGIPVGWSTSSFVSAGDTGIPGYGMAVVTDQGNHDQTWIETPTLNVVAGEIYTLSLDVASAGGCFSSGDCASPHQFSVFQIGNCTGVCTGFGPPGIALLRPIVGSDFSTISFGFFAPASTMALRIQDTTHYPYNLGAIGVIDNVLLTGPLPEGGAGGVPEPESWVLMIGGLGVAGAALRRRLPQTT